MKIKSYRLYFKRSYITAFTSYFKYLKDKKDTNLFTGQCLSSSG